MVNTWSTYYQQNEIRCYLTRHISVAGNVAHICVLVVGEHLHKHLSQSRRQGGRVREELVSRTAEDTKMTRPHLLGEGSEGGHVEVWLGVDDGDLDHHHGHSDEEDDHQPYHHRDVILHVSC